MKYLLLILMLATLSFGQIPEKALSTTNFQLTFKRSASEIPISATFGKGDTMRISWNYTADIDPEYNWLPSVETRDTTIANVPDLWTNGEAIVAVKMPLNYGYWQLRIRALGENNTASTYSTRKNFHLKPDDPSMPANLMIIFQ